jgi:hypothetical protein
VDRRLSKEVPGAVVGQKVTADVVVEGLASATIMNTRVGVGGEPAKEIQRCAPILEPGEWLIRAREAT